MKKLIFATVLNAVTVSSCLLSPAANAATTEFAPVDSIIAPSETVTDELDEWDAELSQTNNEQQLAYSTTCYWEYYPDGSYFWVCYY